MKRLFTFLLVLVMLMSLAACGNTSPSTDEEASSPQKTEELSDSTDMQEDDTAIKESPDKYTCYVKNYVGKNCASIGYTSLGGDRLDHYGAGLLELVYVSPDGEYVDIESEDSLKEYCVFSQNIKPNTEIKYEFEKDENGEEYDNLVSFQNINEVVLGVKKVGAENPELNLTAIEPSSNKYNYYIKDYVGRNCESIGYTSLGGDRLDRYGEGLLTIVFVSPDGTYLDLEAEHMLENYCVTGQSLAPNTEMKFEYEIDEDGKEYSNLLAYQSINEIVLSVKEVGTEDTDIKLTAITPSADKYTWYIGDYVGRNLANCGYSSLGGDLLIRFGESLVKFVIVTDDGSFVDPSDTESLRNFVVTEQSVAPNTELKLVFSKDEEGKEYSNLIESQNIEEIEIKVKKISDSTQTSTVEKENQEETKVSEDSSESADLVDGMRPEFKAAMDSYEEFYDEYVDFMKKYNENPSDIELLSEYAEMVEKLADMDKKFEEWEDNDLNDTELKYYLEVQIRISQKLLDIM